MGQLRGRLTQALLLPGFSLLSSSPWLVRRATSPERFESQILAFEAADAKNPPASLGIVFVGSSTIRLWPDLPAVFPGLPVLQRGFGGATIAGVRRYADRVVLRYEPRIVVLLVGANDLAGGCTPDEILDQFGQLVGQLRGGLPEAHVCAIAINPTLARWRLQPSVDRTNALLAEFVAQRAWMTFIDGTTFMRGPDGRPRPELLRWDGLHLNLAGYRILASVVRPPLERLFATVGSGEARHPK